MRDGHARGTWAPRSMAAAVIYLEEAGLEKEVEAERNEDDGNEGPAHDHREAGRENGQEIVAGQPEAEREQHWRMGAKRRRAKSERGPINRGRLRPGRW